jgi:putative peptidoglycan lipid II flippase
MIMPVIFGSLVGNGAITALNYANRMMFIPLGVFGSAISMAIFPTMSRMAVSGDIHHMDRLLTRGIRATFMFSLPCTAFMITAGLPSIRLVFGYGKFNYTDCRETAFALSFFALGLMGHSANQVINRGFYARKDSITPVTSGMVGLAVTAPLAWILIHTPLRHAGVALAISLATLLNMCILLFLAKRKLSLNILKITPMFLKTFFAAAVMAAVGWWVGSLFNLGPDRFGFKIVLEAFVAIAVSSCGIFILLVKLMRVEEFDELLDIVLRRFKR